MYLIERLKYERSWWKWFKGVGPMVQQLYCGPAKPDPETVRLVFERINKGEPKFRDRYPKHPQKTCPCSTCVAWREADLWRRVKCRR